MPNSLDKNLMTKLAEAEKIRQELNALPIPEDKADKKQARPSGQDAAKGFAASMHIVSGVLVGGLLGYGFDYLVGTKPFGMVIMFPIGMLAGFRNMIRALNTPENTATEEAKKTTQD